MKEGLGVGSRRTGVDAAVDDALARGDRRRCRGAHPRIRSGARPVAAGQRSRLELGQARPRRVELVVEERQPEARRAAQRLHRPRRRDGLGVRARRRELESACDAATIEDVIAHAKAKGVGLLFWYNSGGPHNDVTEAPRDRMLARDVRRRGSSRSCETGASRASRSTSGTATSRTGSRSTATSSRDAADFHLMVDFHGCTIPRGWSREFPNLVGMEAVFGAEQYKVRVEMRGNGAAAQHRAALHPQRRRADGLHAGDVQRLEVPAHDDQRPRARAVGGLRDRACSISPTASSRTRGLPDAPKQFLKDVPAAWDDTRAIAGKPGRAVLVARRAGAVWYMRGNQRAGCRGRDEAAARAFSAPAPGSSH